MNIVISFPTTVDAMMMEKACKKADIEGKLIPVPHGLTTGCGMAWISPVELRDSLYEVMERNDIASDAEMEME